MVIRKAAEYAIVAAIASTVSVFGVSCITHKAIGFAVERAWRQAERRCVEGGGHIRRGLFRGESEEKVPLIYQFFGVCPVPAIPRVHRDEGGELVPEPLPRELFGEQRRDCG